MWRRLRIVPAFILAVVCAAALGSLVQTQFNMAALLGMGVPVPAGLWVRTSLQDLAGFGPVYAVVVAVSFIPAFSVAALLARALPGLERFLFPLAGACGILMAIILANALLPMTPLAVTRYPLGTAALTLAGGIGGLVFVCLLKARSGMP